MTDDLDENIINILEFDPSARRRNKALIRNPRNGKERCKHECPALIDPKLDFVECQDCGAHLNPMWVLGKMAHKEAYWNDVREKRIKHLSELKTEIQDRTRTKCTHCGNMTAIKYKSRMPQTWLRKDDV